MIAPISITALTSVSALGSSQESIWQNYLNDAHCISEKQFENFSALVAQLSEKERKEIELLRNSDAKYRNLDDSVLYGIYVSRKAVKTAGWQSADDFGVNIGSSRGATSLFEKYHKAFLKNKIAPTSFPPLLPPSTGSSRNRSLEITPCKTKLPSPPP